MSGTKSPPPIKTRLLSDSEIATIRERHFGWEKATPALLARIFGVTPQRITAILNATAGDPS